MSDRCREAFEAFFPTAFWIGDRFEDNYVQSHWVTWQAAWNAPRWNYNMDEAPKDQVILVQRIGGSRVLPVEWSDLCPGFALEHSGRPVIFWRRSELLCWQPLPAPAEVEG